MKKQHTDTSQLAGLEPRRSPRQVRAKRTVTKILDATAELLVQKGVHNLTTDRVAEHCGINIATLYHYFPNKQALLHALAQQFAERLQERLDAVYCRLEEIGWRATVDALIDTALEFNRTVKGALAVSHAMQNNATLRHIDYQHDWSQSQFAAGLLAELGIKGSSEQLQLRALVLIQTAGSAIDKALMWYPEHADAAAYEVKLMVRKYIEYYIEQSGDESPGINAPTSRLK